jgi:hypothetical protein
VAWGFEEKRTRWRGHSFSVGQETIPGLRTNFSTVSTPRWFEKPSKTKRATLRTHKYILVGDHIGGSASTPAISTSWRLLAGAGAVVSGSRFRNLNLLPETSPNASLSKLGDEANNTKFYGHAFEHVLLLSIRRPTRPISTLGPLGICPCPPHRRIVCTIAFYAACGS